MDEKDKSWDRGTSGFRPPPKPGSLEPEGMNLNSSSITWRPNFSDRNPTRPSPIEKDGKDVMPKNALLRNSVGQNEMIPSALEEFNTRKTTTPWRDDDDQPIDEAYYQRGTIGGSKKGYTLLRIGAGLLAVVGILVFIGVITIFIKELMKPETKIKSDNQSEQETPNDDLIPSPYKRFKRNFQNEFEVEVKKILSTVGIHAVIYPKRIENEPLSFINMSEDQYNSQFPSGYDLNTTNQILDKVKPFIIPIFKTQIDSRLLEMEQTRQVVGKGKFEPEELESARKKILADLSDTVAVGLEASNLNSPRIEAHKKEIRDRFPTEDAYKKWVKDFYQDEEIYDTWLRLELAGGKYFNNIWDKIEIPDDEVLAFYNENQINYEISERIQIHQIFLRVTDADTNRSHQKEEIDRLLSRIENGESFEQLAKKFSAGGDAVIDIEKGELPKSMEQLIFSLKQGQISPVYESSRGYHIFKMMQYIPQHIVKLDTVRQQIISRLRNERFGKDYPEKIKSLRDKIVIKS